MKSLTHEYRLLINKVAAQGMQIPVSYEIPKQVERSIELLSIQFEQLKIRDEDLSLALPFAGFKDGKIINTKAFVESVEVYVGVHHEKIIEAIHQSFAAESLIRNVLFEDPMPNVLKKAELLSHRNELIEAYQALGYKTINRVLEVDSSTTLKHANALLQSDRDLDAVVDIRDTEDGFKIFYPIQMQKQVLDFVTDNRRAFRVKDVGLMSDSIPGIKDMSDFHHMMKAKTEIKRESNLDQGSDFSPR